MALISEWMQQCGKKVLDDAGIVRDACFYQRWLAFVSVTCGLPPIRQRAYDAANMYSTAGRNWFAVCKSSSQQFRRAPPTATCLTAPFYELSAKR